MRSGRPWRSAGLLHSHARRWPWTTSTVCGRSSGVQRGLFCRSPRARRSARCQRRPSRSCACVSLSTCLLVPTSTTRSRLSC
eukprot:4257168-Lingulodinium_polyedra.AAC.1